MIARFVFACIVATGIHAADFPAPYNSEKLPGAPMPAEEAARGFKLPPGFKATVFAAEPDVQNPIACAWDARGRLWIAENYTYAEPPLRFDPKLRDRILIFEDADGDGHFDKRTVFTDDLQTLTSIELGNGGVYALCPPQLLFIPMKDDRPSGPPRVLLDGFTVVPESHHTFANGLRWGPDGWLYGRVGASSPSKVGPPDAPDVWRVPIAGGIWRYHPKHKFFEMLCHGTTNPWGLDWNEYGDGFFINTVNGHLWQLIPGAHYERSHTIDPNPHVYQLMGQCADHYHFDTGQGWAASRDGKGDAFGGGHAHCGAMIYLGDNWPDEYRGKLFTLNFHGRRINVERLEREGSGYVGKHDGDMALSADPWFRGIDLTYGPDGGVYILDWSDIGECHDSSGVHRKSGRIYKITYGKPKRLKPFDLDHMPTEELMKLQEHKNEWWVRMGRKVLVTRDRSAHETAAEEYFKEQRKEFPDSPDFREFMPSRAEYVGPPYMPKYTGPPHSPGEVNQYLAKLGQTRQPDARLRLRVAQTVLALNSNLIDFSKPRQMGGDALDTIRGVSLLPWMELRNLQRVDGSVLKTDAKFPADWVRELCEQATTEPSAPVRLKLASVLQYLWPEQRRGLAEALVAHKEDAADRNLPLLVWYGIEPLGWDRPGDLVEIAKKCEWPLTRRLITRRLAENIAAKPKLIDELIAIAGNQSPAFQSDVVAGLREGLAGWRRAPKPAAWDDFAAKIAAANDPPLSDQVRELNVLFGDGRALDEVKQLALNGKGELETRRKALETLIAERPADLREICEKLLGVRFLNTTAARGLAKFDDPAIGEDLAKNYRSFHASERAGIIDVLASRPAFARALLAAMGKGNIPRGDLSAFHARQIRGFGDAELTRQLGEVWGELRDSAEDKRALMAQLKAQLTPEALAKANAGAGRVVFNNTCAVCHLLYGNGGQLGPNLTGGNRGNLDYLLENIVDPGAVVSADFRMTVATLKDGRVLNGIVTARTDRTLTLRTMTDTQTVEREDVEKEEQLPQSLMPEGLLLALSEAQIRDLFAYLMTKAQVPLP